MIKVYTGPMFSGKSGAMIAEYKKIYDKKKVICFKSDVDVRDGAFIKSKQYPNTLIPATVIKKFEDIKNHLKKYHKIIFIDEANFINGNAKEIFYLAINKGFTINISGLSLTAEQNPFGQMPYIMAIADKIITCKGECHDCGKEAKWTYFEGKKDKDIVVGDENYMALCDECIKSRNKLKLKI